MKKIIIIGAGPAGLTAAFELSHYRDEYEIIILEGSLDIGGISKTVSHEGNRMDIGGHRFFSKNDSVMDWWFDIMPLQGRPSFDDIKLHREKTLSSGGPDPEIDDDVMLLRQRVSRIYYKGKFFDYPVSLKWSTIRNMGFLTTLKAGFSYIGAIIHKRDETSLENFYINRFGKKLYSMFFEKYTQKLWGRHPRDISADWGAQRVKGLSIRAVIKDIFGKLFSQKKNRDIETSLIEEFYYPKYGPGHLWERVAADVVKRGVSLRRGAEVTGVSFFDGDEVYYEIKYIQDGKELVDKCDILISSMPLKDLVLCMDDADDDVKKIANGLPYRDFVTVGIELDKLNLVNETDIKTLGDIVPDCWIYVQDPGVKMGRIQIFNNWSPYMVKDPENHVWIGLEYFCDEGDDFWSMSDDDCVNFAVGELKSMGVISEDVKITKSHRERVKKAYPAYFDTYDQIDRLVAWIDTHRYLYCIGRNGQHRYNNMDHSMLTAFETVSIIRNGGDKSRIWSVNTEAEYHESKT